MAMLLIQRTNTVSIARVRVRRISPLFSAKLVPLSFVDDSLNQSYYSTWRHVTTQAQRASSQDGHTLAFSLAGSSLLLPHLVCKKRLRLLYAGTMMGLEGLIKAMASNTLPGDLRKAAKDLKGINIPDINPDASEDEKKKTFMVIKEIGKALTDQAEHYVASSVLESLSDQQEITSSSTKLAMAECYLSLGREAKAMKCINSVRGFLLSDPTPEAAEVFSMAESLVEAKLHLRALILLPVAVELYRRLPEADNALEGMFRCIKKTDECTCPLIKEGGRSRVLGIDFGLDLMKNSLEDMLKLETAEQKLAFKHCHVATWISYIYWILNDNAKGIKVRQRGVEHMDRAFGDSAKQYRVYASSFYNMGVGYDILNKSDAARNAYQKAIHAAEHATDFDDDSARQKEIQQYRQKLRELN